MRKIGKKFPFLVYKLQCIFATKIRHFFIMNKMKQKEWLGFLKKNSKKFIKKEKREREREKEKEIQERKRRMRRKETICQAQD